MLAWIRRGLLPHRSPTTFGACCYLWLTSSALAHEDIERQIASLTARIAEEVEKPTLHLRRGELHRVHGDWVAAISDYAQAIELDPDLHTVTYCLAQLLIEVDQLTLALAAVDRHLVARPDNAAAVLLRGRALLKVGLRLAAARELTRGMELHRGSRAPRPDEYLDRARALAAEGGEHADEAVRGLDEGIKKLGGAVTLQLLAIDIEVGRQSWDSALSRLAALESRSPRKESWLVRRGDILRAAGRPLEAQRAYLEARAAIESLPQHCRAARATVALAGRIDAALSRRTQTQGHDTQGLE